MLTHPISTLIILVVSQGIVYDLSVVCGDSSEELVNELLKKASGRRSGVYEHDNLFGGSAGGRGCEGYSDAV
jgi:hypothetical protein